MLNPQIFFGHCHTSSHPNRHMHCPHPSSVFLCECPGGGRVGVPAADGEGARGRLGGTRGHPPRPPRRRPWPPGPPPRVHPPPLPHTLPPGSRTTDQIHTHPGAHHLHFPQIHSASRTIKPFSVGFWVLKIVKAHTYSVVLNTSFPFTLTQNHCPSEMYTPTLIIALQRLFYYQRRGKVLKGRTYVQ